MKLSLKNIIAAVAVLPALSCAAFPSTAYPTASMLATGRWVRVTTDREGIYQLTDAQLAEMGFPDPSKVRVWTVDPFELAEHQFSADLASAPMIQAPSSYTADGRLLFYGQGDARVTATSTSQYTSGFNYIRNYYDRNTSYLLSDAVDVPSIKVQPYANPTGFTPSTSHISVTLQEEELYRRMAGGVLAQGRECAAGDEVPVTFRVKNWLASPNVSNGYMGYVMDAQTDESINAMSVALPDNMNQVMAKNYRSSKGTFPIIYSEAYGFVWFQPDEGVTLKDEDVTFKVKVPSIPYYYVAQDRFMLAYPRENRLDKEDTQLLMSLNSSDYPAGREVRFPDATSTTRVWMIDDLREPIEITGRNFTENGRSFRSFTLPRKASRLIAFDQRATFPSPETVGTVRNVDLFSLPTPEMLIVTTDELLPEAEELADLHRDRQGMDVAVVAQRDILNQFAAGGRQAMAIRMLAKMFYDRDPQKFKYLLLYGASTDDNRFINGNLEFETLVSYENTNRYQSMNAATAYTSDCFFGMLADDYRHDLISFQPTQVAVGRVPARGPAQARDFNAKARRWFDEVPTAWNQNSAVILSGTSNENSHTDHGVQIEQALKAIRPDMTVTQLPYKIYFGQSNLNNPRYQILRDAQRRGIGYLSYSGHGGSYSVDYIEVLSTRTVTNDRFWAPPFVTLASCSQYAFDHLGTSLLEYMLFAPEGGAIAGVASCREVYLNHNLLTAISVARAYAAATPGATVGDVWLDARRRVLAEVPLTTTYEPESLVNNMCYNLAGDPAIPLFPAGKKIRVDDASATPFTPVTISGTVQAADGSVDTGFNGKAHLAVFDGTHEEKTINDQGEEHFGDYYVTVENDILSETDVTVTAGRFSARLSVPEPMYAADSYRVTVTADSAGGEGGSAVGTGRLTIAALPEGVDRGGAPSVTSIYAESADFTPGDGVDSDFMLYAEIDGGKSGLNFATAGVSSRTRLLIDGTNVKSGINSYVTCREDGTYLLAYPMHDMSDGYHSIELIVANNAGFTASAGIELMVMGHAQAGSVALEQECVADYALIDLEDSRASVTRLTVTDSRGETVFTAENPAMPLRWDLKGMDGKAVPDGRYTVRMNVRDGNAYGIPAPGRLLILR